MTMAESPFLQQVLCNFYALCDSYTIHFRQCQTLNPKEKTIVAQLSSTYVEFQSHTLETTKFVHTYIHNWSLQPFSQDFGLASHNTHVVCINFIREWWDYSSTSILNDRLFENFFIAILFTLRVFAKSLLRGKSPQKYFSYFIFND